MAEKRHIQKTKFVLIDFEKNKKEHMVPPSYRVFGFILGY
jgi:hypothetical protein